MNPGLGPAAIAVVLVCVWGGVAALFSLASAWGTRRMWARAQAKLARPPARWPTLGLVRPCEGAEEGLEENLVSTATARYGGSRRVWLCVPARDNAAFAVAERARLRAAELAPDVPVEVLVTDVTTPHNRKVAQLAAAAAVFPADVEVVVQADSDVRFDDETLPTLLAALDDSSAALDGDPRPIGAVSAAPYEVAGPGATFADRLSTTVLSSSQQSFLGLSGLATVGGGVPQVGGALLAMRRAVLDVIDGYHALEPYLGEDFELTLRLYRGGWRIATSSAAARCIESGRTLGEVVRRFSRWALVVRRQRPALFSTYFLLLGCTPLIALAATATALARAPGFGFALGAAGLVIAARTLLASVMRRRFTLPADPFRSLAAFFAAEVLIVIAAARATFSSQIVWRGRRFTVGKGGRLEPPR